MRRIAPLILVSCLLLGACSRNAGSPDQSSESQAESAAALQGVESLIKQDLASLQLELRPLLISDGAGATLMPVAMSEEKERVRGVAMQWRASLDAIPFDALSQEGQRRLQHLKTVVDGLLLTGPGEPGSLQRLGSLAAVDAAVWRIVSSRDVIDARVASRLWADRMHSVGEQVLLRQAQADASLASEWASVACDFSVTLSLEMSPNAVTTAGDGGVADIRDRLIAHGRSGEHCGARVAAAPRAASQRLNSSHGEPAKGKLAALRDNFSPLLASLSLPPPEVVPLSVLVESDPLFAGSNERDVIDVLEEAAQRPDRWLKPLIAEVTGNEGSVEVLSATSVLQLVSAEALLVPGNADQAGGVLLLIDPSRLVARRDWEAAAIVVDALVADCFRQLTDQIDCASRRLEGAADFFGGNSSLPDPRLGVGVLLKLEAYASAVHGEVPGAEIEPMPVQDALGILATNADRRALAVAYGRATPANL